MYHILQAPQPPLPWNGIRSAKEHGPVCYQYDVFTKTLLEGSEDCLYLNVYSPDIKPSNSLPVMVWIHGGSYMSGSGNSDFYGPDFLVNKNVIVVTINYRLEMLGFLCLNTKDVPGNAGMKDQVAALRWVQKNIKNFGGDPNNVTLFGESAGGGSVSYHLISPMSKGLFKRAIVQSGSSNCRWSRAFKPRERAIALARKLGKDTEDDEELYEFYKNLPLESFVKNVVPLSIGEELLPYLVIQFTVVDENLFDGEEAFFHGNIYDQLKNGIHEGVEVITGYTADEGYLVFAKSPVNNLIINFSKYIESFVPPDLFYECTLSDQLDAAKKFKEFYYGSDKVTEENLANLVKYSSFCSFIFDILQWVKFAAKNNKNKIYLYKFSSHSERNIMAQILGADANLTGKPVVAHADDLLYLFDLKVANLPIDNNLVSYKMIENMTNLWTNFAKYG